MVMFLNYKAINLQIFGTYSTFEGVAENTDESNKQQTFQLRFKLSLSKNCLTQQYIRPCWTF